MQGKINKKAIAIQLTQERDRIQAISKGVNTTKRFTHALSHISKLFNQKRITSILKIYPLPVIPYLARFCWLLHRLLLLRCDDLLHTFTS
jgi:hypothetical protein